jgi:hypothetical protein
VCPSNQQTLSVLQHCRARCEEGFQFLSWCTDSVNGQECKVVVDVDSPLVDPNGPLVFTPSFGCVVKLLSSSLPSYGLNALVPCSETSLPPALDAFWSSANSVLDAVTVVHWISVNFACETQRPGVLAPVVVVIVGRGRLISVLLLELSLAESTMSAMVMVN